MLTIPLCLDFLWIWTKDISHEWWSLLQLWVSLGKGNETWKINDKIRSDLRHLEWLEVTHFWVIWRFLGLGWLKGSTETISQRTYKFCVHESWGPHRTAAGFKELCSLRENIERKQSRETDASCIPLRILAWIGTLSFHKRKVK
jgi:hypothetical protein